MTHHGFHRCLEFTGRVLLGYFSLGVTVPIYGRKRFQKVERFTQAHADGAVRTRRLHSLLLLHVQTCVPPRPGWG